MKINEAEKVIDMCQVIQEMKSQGESVGHAEGRASELIKNIKSLIKNAGFSAEQAMDVLDVPKSERASCLAQI